MSFMARDLEPMFRDALKLSESEATVARWPGFQTIAFGRFSRI